MDFQIKKPEYAQALENHLRQQINCQNKQQQMMVKWVQWVEVVKDGGITANVGKNSLVLPETNFPNFVCYCK